ncbi:MAG: UDP-N-acetylglucosamine 4,6-dehydratase (inverting) [Rhodospirillaceae bacterium]|nr:UDP-N-acetylglucosamine 4,6-dehydratase (inverting) [Rhodospirillaceae bacterium]
MIDGKSILVTGATGSFGRRFVETLLRDFRPRRLVVFSRDELKQFEMQQDLGEDAHACLRYFIGDVRDRERVMRAAAGVDIIIHAAAMKQIVAAERNPTECIATNVMGAQNVIDAAIANDVERVVALSTDKAANPINLYGATKLCSDKLFVAANNLAGRHKTRFSVVRYGNVAGSRGSVIPFFKRLVADGAQCLPVTDPAMTRFVITLDQGVAFVLNSLERMTGGELFVPKLPSVRILDLVDILLGPDRFDVVGIRPGEKLHEVMIPLDESRQALDMGDYYVVQPNHTWWNLTRFTETVKSHGRPIDPPFEYASDANDWWMTRAELEALAAATAPA